MCHVSPDMKPLFVLSGKGLQNTLPFKIVTEIYACNCGFTCCGVLPDLRSFKNENGKITIV